jgi:signal transduction histidine kinase
VSEALKPGTPTAPDDLLDLAVRAIGDYSDVESILEVCARSTGMGYCVIAHVTEDRWLACAVLDRIDFGLAAGEELPIKTTLCNEVRLGRETIAFDHASADPRWRDHPTPRSYGLESYIAAPIILEDGSFFGTLCAIDSKPAPASQPEVVRTFELFAKLIAHHLDSERRVRMSQAALLDAQQASELRDQFIAVLGHDLRNPLAALEAGVRLLRRRMAPDPGVTKLLDEMDRSSGRMGRLISDVLDFARGRLGGGIELSQRAMVDMSPAIGLAVRELAMAHTGRIIESDVAEQMLAEGDPDRLAQLTSNLLANAITHGATSSPIRVVGRVADGMLELKISNRGAIPPHILPRLFQPFQRGELVGGRDGLGLGLFIAKQIADAHDGELSATSDDTETCFTFRMPAPAKR